MGSYKTNQLKNQKLVLLGNNMNSIRNNSIENVY